MGKIRIICAGHKEIEGMETNHYTQDVLKGHGFSRAA